MLLFPLIGFLFIFEIVVSSRNLWNGHTEELRFRLAGTSVNDDLTGGGDKKDKEFVAWRKPYQYTGAPIKRTSNGVVVEF